MEENMIEKIEHAFKVGITRIATWQRMFLKSFPSSLIFCKNKD
jgi:hypothetical protein